MSEELKSNNSEKLKKGINIIDLNSINNYMNYKDNIISPINIDKEQLYQSFILFQKFLSMNKNMGNITTEKNINNSNNKVENESNMKALNIKSDDDSKNNYSAKKEDTKFEEGNNKLISENSGRNKNANIIAYDEIPIKPSGYNFIELLEKTLANEKNESKNENQKENENKNLNNSNDTLLSINNLNENNKSKENNSLEKKQILNKKLFDKKDEENNSIKKEENCKNSDSKDYLQINKIDIEELNDTDNENENDFSIHKNKDYSTDNILNMKENEHMNDNNKDCLSQISQNISKIITNKNNFENEHINNNNVNTINILDNFSEKDLENPIDEKMISINIRPISKTKETNSNKNQKEISSFNSFKINCKKNIENMSYESDISNIIINYPILNREKLIEQKIKELNSEIIKFKEEKNKICKLKIEYEKIQNKLLDDVQQFNLKKQEFEKYQKEELNKIKMEKNKLFIESQKINKIKNQNESYAIIIKKNKEIIENLKKQISNYQVLFKQKQTQNRNKKNSKNHKNISIKKIEDLENFKEKKEFIKKRNNSSGNGLEIKNDKNILRRKYQNNNLTIGNIMRDANTFNYSKENKDKDKDKDKEEMRPKLNNKDFSQIELNDNLMDDIKKKDEFSNLNEDNNIQNNGENNISLNYLDESEINADHVKNVNFTTNGNINNNIINSDFMLNSETLQKELLSAKRNINDINNNINNNIKNDIKDVIIENHNKERVSQNTKKSSSNKIKKLNINSSENNRSNKFENCNKKNMHKNNTVSRLTCLNRKTNTNKKNNLFNKTLNNSNKTNNITIYSNTNNKSYNSSSISRDKAKISISKKNKNNTQNLFYNVSKINNFNMNNKCDFIIPKKYLNKEYKLINSIASDDKLINVYTNDKKEILFKSGVKKEIYGDGYQIIYLLNGDIKQYYPDGKIISFFNESQTVQFTFKDGVQVFKFRNGQFEKIMPDGTKQISYPEGVNRYTDRINEKQDNKGLKITKSFDGIKKVKCDIDNKENINIMNDIEE